MFLCHQMALKCLEKILELLLRNEYKRKVDKHIKPLSIHKINKQFYNYNFIYRMTKPTCYDLLFAVIWCHRMRRMCFCFFFLLFLFRFTWRKWNNCCIFEIKRFINKFNVFQFFFFAFDVVHSNEHAQLSHHDTNAPTGNRLRVSRVYGQKTTMQL